MGWEGVKTGVREQPGVTTTPKYSSRSLLSGATSRRLETVTLAFSQGPQFPFIGAPRMGNRGTQVL